MTDVLKQFTDFKQKNTYMYGKIISVSSNGFIGVKTQSNVSLVVKESSPDYIIGDKLILGITNGDLNTAFIIKKTSVNFPSSENYVID